MTDTGSLHNPFIVGMPATTHSVDDIVMFTGSWLSSKITQFDEQTQAVLSKITEDFVVQLGKQTAALRNHISSLEDKVRSLTSQNNQLTTDKQRLKTEKEQAKTELKNAQSEFNERLNIEDKMAKKELKNKYRDMTKKPTMSMILE